MTHFSFTSFRVFVIDIIGMSTEFLDLLKRVDTWRDYRNEIMHALMNKNLVAIDEHLAEKCEEGMALARELQAQVKRVKYGNRIRRSIKLPVR